MIWDTTSKKKNIHINFESINYVSTFVSEDIEKNNIQEFEKTLFLSHKIETKNLYYLSFYNKKNKKYEIYYFHTNNKNFTTPLDQLSYYTKINNINDDQDVLFKGKKYCFYYRKNRCEAIIKNNNYSNHDLIRYIEFRFNVKIEQIIETESFENLELPNQKSLKYKSFRTKKQSFYLIAYYMILVSFIFHFYNSIDKPLPKKELQVEFKQSKKVIKNQKNIIKLYQLFDELQGSNLRIKEISFDKKYRLKIIGSSKNIITFLKNTKHKINIIRITKIKKQKELEFSFV